jgi:hypothetical protein
MALGAAGLFVSLFLTWTHQLPRGSLAGVGGPAALRGVPRDATAWQVYSVADVMLALVVLAVLAVAVYGGRRRVRVSVLLVVAIALAFAVHADNAAPTNGVLVLDPAASEPRYVNPHASAGPGETVAITSLGLAAAGIILSLLPAVPRRLPI